MDSRDLDKLFLQLRNEAPFAPDRLAGNVILRLGPPVESLRSLFLAGVATCLAGVILSATISRQVVKEDAVTAPPELGLFSMGIGPLASL